jgi:outer membrane receptor protein involved in Fe transport
MRLIGVAAAAGFTLIAGVAHAEDDPVTTVRQVEVTATRIPEEADKVPAYISVIPGSDLRDRHAVDLRTTLSLVAGVEAPSGGDAGPASAVPSFWGLHEFDAFLLVEDGVPLGGAFNPAIPDLDLTDVSRVEVLKGSAPVMYGATAFVGVIQVLHYPAGEAENRAEVSYGSYDSWRGSASMVLPTMGDFKQSLAIDGEREGFADDRERVSDGKLLYRLSGPLGGGTVRLDLGLDATRVVPPSPLILSGTALTTLTPLDGNYNPSNAKIDENRYHAVVGYSHPTPWGDWETTASLSYAHIHDVRGFLRPDLTDDGFSANADSQDQDRNITDDYFDTHLTQKFGNGLSLVWGADLLYGRGTQASTNGEYYAPLAGGTPLPSTTGLHVDEINTVWDRRWFGGEYVQGDWRFAQRWDLTFGARLNETSEWKHSTHFDGFDPTADTDDTQRRNVTRPTGTVGLTYQAWEQGPDELVFYADYRNSFKPAALDFGPDNTPDILNPETANSYEAGIKGVLANGRFDYEAGFFLLDFKNLVVATTDVNGDQFFQNAGGERLKGFETEGRWRLAPDLSLAGAFAWHDARFTHYIAAEGGANVDASGNQLTLAPHYLASLGLIYAPKEGPFGSVVASYVGRRYLDLANMAPTEAYTTVDATVGYRWGRYSVSVNGYNLTDQRKPVTASEFGDQSYYLTPPRKVFLTVGASF